MDHSWSKVAIGVLLDRRLFLDAILKLSRRKNRTTMSSQEGINQIMVVIPIQLVFFRLPFLSQGILGLLAWF